MSKETKKSVQLSNSQITDLIGLCSQQLATLNRHSVNAGVPVESAQQAALKALINALESK